MDTKKRAIIEALLLTKGIVTPACEKIGLARSTFYLWLKEDSEFNTMVTDIQDVALDFAEEKLFELIKLCDTTAIIFFLKTRGKKRGYIERVEVDNVNPIQLLINDPLDANSDNNSTSENIGS